MRICRFNDDHIGIVRDERAFDVTALVKASARSNGVQDPVIAALPSLRRLTEAEIAACPTYPLDRVRLLSPIQAPGKIVAAPVNYQAHILEMHASNVSPGHNIPEIGKAGLFLKANSSLAGPSQGVALRFPDRRTDHEIELVAIIGKTANEVSHSDALQYVAGYCLGLDITLRGPEDRSFRKSIDSYSVLGPWLTTADEIADPQKLQLSLHNNGELRQNTPTSDMVYDVARIIEFASSFYTLHPGDIVYTGTPQGVGPIVAGDRLRAHCKELGTMDVSVRAAG
jgi:2-keto-4-pentenoate hydratase/2-oxohepta-3-ene-1,7-dioic acid hydratase in catechol pathway